MSATRDPQNVSETQPPPRQRLSTFARFWQRFVRQRLALAAAGYILLLLLLALFAPWLAPYDPYAQTLRSALLAPTAEHWLGTDALGRDTLSRLLYGARISMQAALAVVGIAASLGVTIGLIVGYYGGLLDRLAMWVVDIFFAIPPIVLSFAILTVLGPGLLNIILAIGLIMSTRYIRLTRGVMLAEREQVYVESARVGGLTTPTILFRHLLPNIAPPLIIQSTQMFAAVLLIEAALSFLGLGVPVGEPSWGRMLAESQSNLARQPFLPLPPGLILTLTVLAFNLLGDGLRDALERESGPMVGAPRQSVPTPAPATSPAAQAAVPATAQPEPASATALLAVRHLDVCFPRPHGSEVQILHDVSFDLAPGETLGLVGESGSGKSMTALALLGLVPPPGRISGGSICVNGRELVGMSAAQLRRVRGREIAMIFQEPMASLNPVHTVGHQLIEPLRLLHGLNYRQARSQAQELLALVQVPDPQQRLDSYPHQFSGGMAQRVMIARALACNQRLLVADEPTTALDVSVRGQILELLSDIQRQFGMAVLLITHDLGVVAEVCDRVAVMYAGQICEIAPVTELFKAPRHPYTAALLATQPRLDTNLVRLPVLEGTVPHPTRWPQGCRFHPRCAFAADVCRQGDPPLRLLEPFDGPEQSPVAYNGQVVASNQPARASRCVRVDDIALTIEQDERAG